MRIYIFKSETRKGLHAFAGNPMGSKLPQNHGPWTVTGVVGPDRAPPHNFSLMRSKKQSMLKGFSSGGWAKRRKPNPDRRRLRCWPATCSARMHPRGNHEVQQLLHFSYWVIAGR